MDETRGIVGHDHSAAGVIALKDTRGIVGHDRSATRVRRRKQCPPYWDRDCAEVPKNKLIS